MASPKIKFKRSAVASKRPSLGSLELGELALNTYDGKLFTRRDTSGVGIATTVSTINPWTENYGSSAISYDGNISVAGVTTFNGQVHLPDNTKIMLGANNDMQIVHVPNYNSIQGDQVLYLQSPSEIVLKQYNGSEVYAKFTKNSSVKLYYDNSKKFETTGIGITVFGNTETQTLNVSGVSTFTGAATFNGNITGTGDLTLTDTDSGSSAGPELKLYRNSSSPADADYLGQIKFAGESDTGVERNYAKITGKILDASNGTEDGIIEFAHIKAGSQNISARFRSDSLQLINGTSLTVNGSSTFTGNILANSDSTVDIGTNSTRFANVYADTYYGDGSNLTGISAGAGGTENVSSNTTISGIITASDQFYPPTLTTSERDALTVTQGALIFNTTDNKVQMYLGSEWKSLAFELDTYTAVGL
jgi:hypothetical protein